MAQTKRKYENAMRNMIRKIQNGEDMDFNKMTPEDREILSDCIKSGYVIGEATNWDERLRTQVTSRDNFGYATPLVVSSIIPLKGLIFLENKPDWKFIIPTIISVLALLVSVFRC